MNIIDLFSLQGTLFLLILVGVVLTKIGIINEEGRKCLIDLSINIIIPCNILKSFFMDVEINVLVNLWRILIVGFIMQAICMILNKFLYNKFEEKKKRVLQYCTLVSAGGFIGSPVAEGIYGTLGLLYSAIFLISMRIVTWSIGTSYFVGESSNKKEVLKNVLTHPCLVAVYLGIIMLLTQITLPSLVESAVVNIGNCNSAVTMFVIGTILADVNVFTIVNKVTLKFSIIRLLILPFITLIIGKFLMLDKIALGVSVLMIGMPAGSTAAIFAARYNSDAPFATKCVVLTTLLSMITIPLWSYFLI